MGKKGGEKKTKKRRGETSTTQNGEEEEEEVSKRKRKSQLSSQGSDSNDDSPVALVSSPSFAYEPTPALSRLESGSVEVGKARFEWMIHPVTAEQFFEDSFEKRPLHVKRGQKNYYKEVFSTKEFDEILSLRRVYFGKNLDVTSYSEEEGRETHNPVGRAHPPVVWDFYNNGCSIRMINPQASPITKTHVFTYSTVAYVPLILLLNI